MPAETAFRPALEIVDEIKSGHAAPSDIARATLDHVQEVDPVLNAFTHLDPDTVMAEAKVLDDRLAAGEDLGPLGGLPIPIKDLIAVKDMPLEFGSRTMRGNISVLDAPSVERLRAAGAVILGKTTTSEFGCKGTTEGPHSGITRNPWDTVKTTGGSSGGAAALAAAGVSPVTIGTDGGGSVRIPASFCGLFTIKAQFGRVPIHPVSATHSLAHVGPLSRSVRDAALVLSVIAGPDSRDHTSMMGPPPDFLAACDREPGPLRVVYSPTFGYAKPDPDVTKIAAAATGRLAEAGCEVDVVDELFPDPVNIWASEFYAGVATRLKDALETRPEDLDPVVLRLMDWVTGLDLATYYSAVFDRFSLRERVRGIFEKYDIIASPTLPVPAFDVGLEVPPGYEDRTAVDWVYYTYPFNLTGHPAVSINAGFTDEDLPVGLQLVGKPLAEETLFSLSAAFEALTPGPVRRPGLEPGPAS